MHLIRLSLKGLTVGLAEIIHCYGRRRQGEERSQTSSSS